MAPKKSATGPTIGRVIRATGPRNGQDYIGVVAAVNTTTIAIQIVSEARGGSLQCVGVPRATWSWHEYNRYLSDLVVAHAIGGSIDNKEKLPQLEIPALLNKIYSQDLSRVLWTNEEHSSNFTRALELMTPAGAVETLSREYCLSICGDGFKPLMVLAYPRIEEVFSCVQTWTKEADRYNIHERMATCFTLEEICKMGPIKQCPYDWLKKLIRNPGNVSLATYRKALSLVKYASELNDHMDYERFPEDFPTEFHKERLKRLQELKPEQPSAST